MKRKLVIENFKENTTIHGISYLNQKNKIANILWSVLLLILLSLMLTSTFYYLIQYLKFESHIIDKEREIDTFDGLPSVLICKTDKLSIFKSIIDVKPELKAIFDLIEKPVNLISSINEYKMKNISFIDQKIDHDFINNLKKKSQSLSFIKKCEIKLESGIVSCTELEQRIIFTFNGLTIISL